MGDFAVALRTRKDGSTAFCSNTPKTRSLKGDNESIHILDVGDENPEPTLHTELHRVEWIGYAGVRDATTTSIPPREEGDDPLPPWQEMVEVRYGVHGEYWGKGVAREAAGAVMRWAEEERGVRRFIAETEKTNTRSGRVLGKMGFRESGTGYWKDEEEMEWERVVR